MGIIRYLKKMMNGGFDLPMAVCKAGEDDLDTKGYIRAAIERLTKEPVLDVMSGKDAVMDERGDYNVRTGVQAAPRMGGGTLWVIKVENDDCVLIERVFWKS